MLQKDHKQEPNIQFLSFMQKSNEYDHTETIKQGKLSHYGAFLVRILLSASKLPQLTFEEG